MRCEPHKPFLLVLAILIPINLNFNYIRKVLIKLGCAGIRCIYSEDVVREVERGTTQELLKVKVERDVGIGVPYFASVLVGYG